MSNQFVRGLPSEDDGVMYFECDNCGSEAEFYGTWRECVNQAKEIGWKVFKNEHNQWVHMCSSTCCVAYNEEENRG